MISLKTVIDNPLFEAHQYALNVDGLNLLPNMTASTINDALIIQGPFSERAIESARNLRFNTHLVKSFNYLDRVPFHPLEYSSVQIKNISPSQQHAKQSWLNHLHLKSRMTHNQACRILNHMAAWDACIAMNKPCVILEHDAFMLAGKVEHVPRNSIQCFSRATPYHHNNNWECMGEAFAYSVDRFSANRLFNKVLKEGLVDPLELMIRLDEFLVIFNRKASRISYADSSAATLDSNA
jgi:hypothetical protein